MAKTIDCPVCKGTGFTIQKLKAPGPLNQKKPDISVKVPCPNARCDQGQILV
ncbi:MAG: hypothetical protein HY528_01995 [Chloroflexi bacterium]|nr:hypothetical protein [Chloroflexota bacterium]